MQISGKSQSDAITERTNFKSKLTISNFEISINLKWNIWSFYFNFFAMIKMKFMWTHKSFLIDFTQLKWGFGISGIKNRVLRFFLEKCFAMWRSLHLNSLLENSLFLLWLAVTEDLIFSVSFIFFEQLVKNIVVICILLITYLYIYFFWTFQNIIKKNLDR